LLFWIAKRVPTAAGVSSLGPDGKEMTMAGIYALEGDTLKVCISGVQDRPKEFVANKEYTVITLKRAAP
jgi:uncharacterized protein (TIGR03067 family)